MLKKVGVLSAVAMMGAALVTTAPAKADDGGAIAAGIIGGLAVGALAGSAASGGYGYGGGYGYDYGYAPAPVYRRTYVEPEYEYAPGYPRRHIVRAYGYPRGYVAREYYRPRVVHVHRHVDYWGNPRW
jgi:hypothetical protein